MIDYVKGEIGSLNPAVCVVECNGVGYGVNISLNTFNALQGQKQVKLYVYESIREDAYQLFGFMTEQERALFMLLISVSGVGAGTARMILSSYTVEELVNAISHEDVNAIKRVKGIGLKSAQRIIVDLKDKVLEIAADGSSMPVPGSMGAKNEVAEEAIAALVALGFQQSASVKVVEKIVKEEPELKVGAVVKKAMKSL